ncbi:MAG: DUF559 domain-containing protein [Bacteroidia bacterium]|nr:DUF559 domain-containing protein [Bacteroidia bacterium]
MLAIELDGFSHQLEEVEKKDRIKEKRMNDSGITILRFDDREVMDDIENVLRVIERKIEEIERN